MRPLNLRWRLTAYYGAVLAVLALVAGAAFYSSLKRGLTQTMDEELSRTAGQVVAQWDANLLHHRGQDLISPSWEKQRSYRISVSILDPNRQQVAHWGGGTTAALPTVPGVQSVQRQRVFNSRTRDGFVVQVVTSESDLFEALGHTQKLLLLGLPFLVLVGLGSGFLLIDRALGPVDAVSRVAEDIAASGQYTRRVPEPSGGDDEAVRAARAVNAMLTRLERQFDVERAFALAAAHELRTPLSVLLARTQLALEDDQSNSDLRAALRRNENSAQELVTLVEGLLALARSNGPQGQDRGDLSDLALAAVEQVQDRQPQVHFHLDLNGAALAGDSAALRLAVNNLLDNAVKYGRGQVWVETGRAQDRAFLIITDDGPGIPETELPRVMRPFQRHRADEFSGAGLGLALVQAVVQQHAGQLHFGPAARGGWCAQLEFPALKESPDDPSV